VRGRESQGSRENAEDYSRDATYRLHWSAPENNSFGGSEADNWFTTMLALYARGRTPKGPKINEKRSIFREELRGPILAFTYVGILGSCGIWSTFGKTFASRHWPATWNSSTFESHY